MTKKIEDALFDSYWDFIRFMRKYNNRKIRKQLLVTDRLRVWYCLGVTDEYRVYSNIKSDMYRVVYCSSVTDRECVWSAIRDKDAASAYCSCVRDRPEVQKYKGEKYEDS